MFGLSTTAHKKHIQAVRRNLTKIASPELLPVCKKTCELFFGGMSVSEIEMHSDSHWAEIINDFVNSIKKYNQQSGYVRVFNPSKEKDGFDNNNTVIQIICPDMPFIVDSVVLALAKNGLAMQLMTHPVANVSRSKSGVLKSAGESGDDFKESWTHIEISRIVDIEKISEIQTALELVINKVTVCVQDWKSMLGKVEEAKNDLVVKDSKSVHGKQLKFIDWLLDDNFTFLGY